jgi:hypothetical protein
VFLRQDVGGIVTTAEKPGGRQLRAWHTAMSEEQDARRPGSNAADRHHSSNGRSGACPIRHPPTSGQ